MSVLQMGHEALFSQTGVDIVTGHESKVRSACSPARCSCSSARKAMQ